LTLNLDQHWENAEFLPFSFDPSKVIKITFSEKEIRTIDQLMKDQMILSLIKEIPDQNKTQNPNTVVCAEAVLFQSSKKRKRNDLMISDINNPGGNQNIPNGKNFPDPRKNSAEETNQILKNLFVLADSVPDEILGGEIKNSVQKVEISVHEHLSFSTNLIQSINNKISKIAQEQQAESLNLSYNPLEMVELVGQQIKNLNSLQQQLTETIYSATHVMENSIACVSQCCNVQKTKVTQISQFLIDMDVQMSTWNIHPECT